MAGGVGGAAEQCGEAAKFTHLTTRDDNRLARQQARTACAAALLRWIHVVVTRQVKWDPAIAAESTALQQGAGTDRRATPAATVKTRRGDPEPPSRNTSRMSLGSPARLLHRARFTLSGTTRLKARQSTGRRRSNPART
jgi:hypothetical protein